MNEKRNFKQEMEQLKQAYPQLDHIPEEVAQAASKGQSLLEAYEDWMAAQKVGEEESLRLKAENRQLKEENALLKKEVAILKQNASAGARAVGSGVHSRGGAQVKPRHAFLDGLESDGW